jgi:nicotinamidase/pyrazinamidase
MTRHFSDEDAIVVVDVQNDFCPGGALEVPRGDEVVPVLNNWIDAARQEGARIVASRDWHPAGHVSFEKRGGPWPPHCIRNTSGAAFHPDLDLPEDVWIISKGESLDSDEYSVFDRTGLAERLNDAGVVRVWIGGLAMDVCVCQTVLDGAKKGFEVHLLLDATRAIDSGPGDRDKALEEMKNAGAIIEEGRTP